DLVRRLDEQAAVRDVDDPYRQSVRRLGAAQPTELVRRAPMGAEAPHVRAGIDLDDGDERVLARTLGGALGLVAARVGNRLLNAGGQRFGVEGARRRFLPPAEHKEAAPRGRLA